MPSGRRVLVGKTAAERKRLRAALGSLRSLKISKSVQVRYDRAVSNFLWYCVTIFGAVASSLSELDCQASYYIMAAWEEGEPRSVVADTLSGLLHKLEQKRILTVAWSWLTVWERHEMPNRAPPLLPEQALSMAGLYLFFNLPEMALATILGFHCMMRTAEILAVRKCHVSWGRGKASITVLGKTAARTGHVETVVVEDPMVLLLLMAVCQMKAPMELLFSGSSHRFRMLWSWGIDAIGFSSEVYKPYAIRRGGATDDWAKFMDAAKLLMRGRWGSINTAKIYAVEGLRVRDQDSVTDSQKEKMAYWGKVLHGYLQKLEKATK